MFDPFVAPEDVVTGNRIFAGCAQREIPYAKLDRLLQTGLPDAETLVTHNGGYNLRDAPRGRLAITSLGMAGIYEVPTALRTWWGQNADARHPVLRGLPLGVDNWEMPTEAAGREEEYPLPPDGSRAGELVAGLVGRPRPARKGLLYVNLRWDTNPYERMSAAAAVQGKPWATWDGRRETADFLEQIRSHDFVLSPEGNGIDCTRTWEALYLGTAPIVRRTRALEWFEGLPILFVDSWSDVTEERLELFRAQVQSKRYSVDKLRLSWWLAEIERRHRSCPK